MNTDKDTEDLPDDDEFEDALPPGDEPTEPAGDVDDGKPRGFASGPPWARYGLIGLVVVVGLFLLYQCSGKDKTAESEGPTTTAAGPAAVDPLADRPKVNTVVSAVVGKSADARQRIADVVNRAEKQGADLCSLYWGMDGRGWSIEYQHPGGPLLPNATHNVPVFVDTRCFPSPTSPLPTFEALPVPVTTTVRGQAIANGAHPALNPTAKGD